MSARSDYKRALADKDWPEAVRLRNLFPDELGAVVPGVPDGMAAIISDPLEPEWMIVEWSVQKNDCKDTPNCREYALGANQFDHFVGTPAKAQAWFDQYVTNRQAHAPCKDQLGQTLFLLQVDQIVQITDFDGVAL